MGNHQTSGHCALDPPLWFVMAIIGVGPQKFHSYLSNSLSLSKGKSFIVHLLKQTYPGRNSPSTQLTTAWYRPAWPIPHISHRSQWDRFMCCAMQGLTPRRDIFKLTKSSPQLARWRRNQPRKSRKFSNLLALWYKLAWYKINHILKPHGRLLKRWNK